MLLRRGQAKEWVGVVRVVRVGRLYCSEAVTEAAGGGGRREWGSAESRLRFLEELARKQGVKQPEDWRRVTFRQATAAGGGGLLARYGGSLEAALVASLPADQRARFEAAPRRRAPRGHWDVAENQQAFLATLARRHGLDLAPFVGEGPPAGVEESRVIFKAWTRVPASAVREAGGSGLVARLGDSMTRTLAAAFPRLRPPAAAMRRRQVWSSQERRRAFLEEVAAEQGLDPALAASWRRIQYADVAAAGGKGLLNRYGGSVFRLLQDTFPELDLREVECRGRVSRGHWEERENRLAFLRLLQQQHGVACSEDWRTVTAMQVRELPGGSGFLNHYNGSFFAAICDLLGEGGPGGEAWEAVKAVRPMLPQGYWKDESNVKAFLQHCEKVLRVEKPEDWARVSRNQLVELGGGTLLHRASLPSVLERVYPNVRWRDLELGGGTKRSSQRLLSLLVEQILPRRADPAASSC